MKNSNTLLIILLCVALNSCNGLKKNESNSFRFDNSKLKATYHTDDMLSFSLLNTENKEIDSIVYYINDEKIGTKKDLQKIDFDLTNQKLGYQNLKALVYFEGENQETTARVELVSNIQPKLLKYKTLNAYPHDYKAYTQGLEFYRDTLIEGTGNGSGNGTGLKGTSSLRKTNYRTGEVYKIVTLPESVFGEGITIINNKIFQLTWQNNEAYVYNADTFKKEKTHPYFKKIEGWGLTNDGTNLLMSDGTEKIWTVDSQNFKEIDYINVYSASSKIKAVNELEWIDGKIYANIYQMDAIAIINPKSGAVEGVINLGDLKSKVSQHPDLDVLNGIAYNPKTKTIFVTGKNWDKMFEIKIIE